MANRSTSKDRFAGVRIPKLPSMEEIEQQLRSMEPVPAQPEDKEVYELACAHVDWLLRVVRPLMIEQFIHGFKHGRETRRDMCHAPEASER